MPIYRFKCSKCKKEFEELVPHRGDTSPCPKCGCEKVERMVSVPAQHISGNSGGDFSCADGTCGLPTCMDGKCDLN